MRSHIDVLGLFQLVWGGFGVLAGVSLGVLAIGMRFALSTDLGHGVPERAGVWVLAVFGAVFVAAGALAIAAGRWLRRKRPSGRVLALTLVVPHAVVVPFGTALAMYTCWVLLNDDARREFGRPPRSPQAPEGAV